MKSFRRLFQALTFTCAAGCLAATTALARPNLIVTTDIGGDPDDQQSMRRLMLYSNEFNILSLVASASGIPGQLKQAVVQPQCIQEIIKDYAAVQPSLSHYGDYPSPEDLAARVKSGNPNRGVEAIGEGKDTEGSNDIIAQVDGATRRVCITIWGGATDVAQALFRVRASRSAPETDRFTDKIIIYAIGDQDAWKEQPGTVDWIQQQFPKLKLVMSRPHNLPKQTELTRGMYQNDSKVNNVTLPIVEDDVAPLNQEAWLDVHVLNNHGPLGARYPANVVQNAQTKRNTKGIKEGDTPSWFYFLPHGLSDPEQPPWGGWGGRFQLTSNSYYTDGQDNHFSGNPDEALRRKWTVARWRKAYQNDFQARMDRCVSLTANRNPIAVVNGDSSQEIIRRNAAAGGTVKLDAGGSSDPDNGQTLSWKWWVYQEAGSFAGDISIANPTSSQISVPLPPETAGQQIHVILEVTDNGEPALTSYRRVVINCAASSGT